MHCAAILGALYSGFGKQDVVENDTRARLLRRVGERPGILECEAARLLNLHPNTLAHHVQTLRARNYVTVIKPGKFRMLYPAGGAPRAAEQAAREHWAREPRKARIVKTLTAHGSLAQHDLAAMLGMNRHALAHHLRILITAGLVRRDRVGREARYRVHGSDAAPATG